MSVTMVESSPVSFWHAFCQEDHHRWPCFRRPTRPEYVVLVVRRLLCPRMLELPHFLRPGNLRAPNVFERPELELGQMRLYQQQ